VVARADDQVRAARLIGLRAPATTRPRASRGNRKSLARRRRRAAESCDSAWRSFR